MNENNKQASVPASTDNSSSSSPGPYSVAPGHMTDSMSRYGQAVAMGPDTLGRNLPPGSGPPPPPPSALSPWQGYVYSVDPAARGLAPFPGQPYRSPYPAFPGQYSEPYDPYIPGPLPPDYPLNIRYPGDKGTAGLENNGMGYNTLMDNRTPPALPPFSTIATHPSSGRGPTPGLKDDIVEFGDGLNARLSRVESSGPPTPGHGGQFEEGLTGRLMDRSLSREDSYNSSSSLVQYRPWEIGSGGRGEPTSSSHASPTSPSSSYSFAEGFLKFQPGTPTTEKGNATGGGSGGAGGTGNSTPSGGNVPSSGTVDGTSPGSGTNDDKSAWYHGKGGAPSPYSKDSSALPHPPPSEKHANKEGGGGGGGSNTGAASGASNAIAGGSGPSAKNNNDIISAEPSRPPTSSSVGYGGDGSNVPEDSKVHLTNSYPPYDSREILIPFSSPHQNSPYNYYSPNPVPGGAPWGYSDMSKTSNYHGVGRPYNHNGRESIYGNGNAPDRPYQLSPHDKMSIHTTPTPPPPPGGPGYQGNTHVPIHPKAEGKAERGHRGVGGVADSLGQVPSVSSSMQPQAADSKNQIMGHDDYGPPPAKQAAVASTADDQGQPTEKPKKKKRKRCGECYGCQRKDNCGECAPCRNEKSHQICKMRRCEKLIERKVNAPAPPAPPPPPPPVVTAHIQQATPQTPSTVSDKLQYIGGGGAGTAWW